MFYNIFFRSELCYNRCTKHWAFLIQNPKFKIQNYKNETNEKGIPTEGCGMGF